MGEVKVKVALENYDDRVVACGGFLAEDQVRSQCVDVLVDSEAVMLVLPQDLVEALGLRTLRKAIVTYADERKEERDIAGVVSVGVAGRKVETNCVVGPPGSEPLLGQIVLEEADLLIDCAHQRLIPRPESPYLPTLKLK
ncbi:MAG: clan AA aspartic protease [Planctomycetota bacterium]|nr:clan AA aspartic protease [Planctomycetota bacterium]